MLFQVLLTLLIVHFCLTRAHDHEFDVIVYGSTPAGVMAAVSASRVGGNDFTVALLSTTNHVGGMCAGGLGRTDIGPHPDEVIGGLAREFFIRNGAWYNQSTVEYYLEPHVAADIFKTMLSESHVTLLLSVGNVLSAKIKKGTTDQISAITTENGDQFNGGIFIDASYEGDLLATAGVSHAIGREARSLYGESYAGIGAGLPFLVPVDPFVDGTQTKLLPLMTSELEGPTGEGDGKVQAYNFRLCVTKTNKAPFPAPENYKPERWELFRRYINILEETNLTDKTVGFPSRLTNRIPNDKYDCNNQGAIGTDYVGGSWKYPTASYRERQKIWEEHKQYMLELFWFLKTDEAVPEYVRNSANDWGLCADEFRETDHWPPQLYVREARRMLGDSVFTQNSIESQSNDGIGLLSIGLAAYNYDAHKAQRVVRRYSSARYPFAWSEGEIEVGPGIYQIPLYVLLPKRDEMKNLVAAICVSASHVAFSSLRMEPQYMIMGQAAGTIASLALKDSLKAVHDVDRTVLRKQLLYDGQILDKPSVTATVLTQTS